MEESDTYTGHDSRRPPAMTLISGMYLFLFLLTVSSYGQPLPFFGAIYRGMPAGTLIFFDSLLCLYLFLGLMKRQRLTWYLLLGYNAFEVVNTLTNLLFITPAELEKIVGKKVDTTGLLAGNVCVIVAVLLISCYVFRQRGYFGNRSKYLF